jgi:hypothetical protein
MVLNGKRSKENDRRNLMGKEGGTATEFKIIKHFEPDAFVIMYDFISLIYGSSSTYPN